jgi:N-methylhydantoinase A
VYYIGADIGGTFTDCVLVDRDGNHSTAKTLSTKDDPVAGVLAGHNGWPRTSAST